MSDEPEPLVPPEIDLRDLDGFMLNVERLLASELWALSDGRQLKAAVSLWCRAWKQVPAASLPSDETVLAAFAGLTPKQFQDNRWIVMRGFVKCRDGRWYHKVLAVDALRAWKSKQRRTAERDADNERLKRWRERRRNENETPSGNDGETGTKRDRQGQGQGQGQRKQEQSARGARLAADWALPPEWRSAAEQARRDAVLPPCNIDLESASFRDFWIAKPGAGGVKLDWRATWLNWVRRANSRSAQGRLPMNGQPAGPVAAASGGVTGGSREDIEMQVHMGVMTQAEGDEALAKLARKAAS